MPKLWRRQEKAPPSPQEHIERRRPVWQALSTLYLDTELTEQDHAHIARTLRESRYSAAQLEEILYRELHPVLLANLLSPAGHWAAFDLDWLQGQVLSRRPVRRALALVWGASMVEPDWQAIKSRL